MEELSPEKSESLQVFKENNIPIFNMSTITEEGVSQVKLEVAFHFYFLC